MAPKRRVTSQKRAAEEPLTDPQPAREPSVDTESDILSVHSSLDSEGPSNTPPNPENITDNPSQPNVPPINPERLAAMNNTPTPSASGPQASADLSTLLSSLLVKVMQQAGKATDKESDLKLPDPTRWEGKGTTELETFLRDLSDYFAAKPQLYASDKNKILYATSRLSGNVKSAWRHQYDEIDDTLSYQDFKDFLWNYIEPQGDRCLSAVYRLLTLEQKQTVRALFADLKEPSLTQ